MDTLIDALDHPKGVWTSIRGQKIWYIPYFSKAVADNKSGKWLLFYNNGDVSIDLQQTDSILFYGATGDMPLAFLDDCGKYGVTISIHRTHIARPFIAYGWRTVDRDDLLSKQILTRHDEKKAAYMARQLVRYKLLAQRWLQHPSDASLSDVAECRTVNEVRTVEAQVARRYWDRYFNLLDLPDSGRRVEGAVQESLDAGAKYLSGIILRWILSHALSPAHGFLHSSTSYPALVADMIEPYRYMIDKPVFDLLRLHPGATTGQAITAIKNYLDQPVLVEPTRQHVYRRSMLHGAVLALRHYLQGDMKRFHPPHEVDRIAGRKFAASYKLIGEIKE